MHTQTINFQAPTEEAALFILPSADIFAGRAARFEHLACAHSLSHWLQFLGQLTQAQHEVLHALEHFPSPDTQTLERAHTHGMPLFDLNARPALWRDALRQLIGQLEKTPLPAAASTALTELRAADDAQLENLANVLLDGEISAAQTAQLPFIAAALQVVYTGMAAHLDHRQLQKLDAPALCPCCGSPAVASVVRLGNINNLRYLHCSLCNSEWNLPRATCSACSGDKEIALHQLEGQKDSIRAETCDACMSYLKIMYQEKDPQVDPVADDLASLALDMLVDEAGYQRNGPNLFLIGAHRGANDC